jgi:hypothetical protein
MINFLLGTGGYMPFIGLVIGIFVDALAGFQEPPTKTKPETWAALVGAIGFGLETVFDHRGNPAGVIAMRALSAALGGAICCWLWGLLGGVIGRKLLHRRRKIVS